VERTVPLIPLQDSYELIKQNFLTDRLLTERELADWLKVSIPTLRRWRMEGIGPEFIKCGPSLVCYQLAAVQRWLAEGTKN
jgi:predicted DNA-binding transcriptional regulator AlpA